MSYYKIFIISLFTTLATLGFIYNYITFDPIYLLTENDNLGADITTINGSDKIKDSRAVINTNFTNLNNDKIETSTTSLPLIVTLSGLTTASSLDTVGTITTGTWNADALTVTYGGTGTTTLTANSVLLGNGTNSIVSLGAGSENQVLTMKSGVPTWTSTAIDETADYIWTGHHTFNATSTFSASTTWNILPEYTSDPKNDNEAVRKSYVDNYLGEYFADTWTIDPGGSTATTSITYNFDDVPKFVRATLVTSGSEETNGVEIRSFGTYDGTNYETIWQGDGNVLDYGVSTNYLAYYLFSGANDYYVRMSVTSMDATSLELSISGENSSDPTNIILIEVIR